MGYLESKNQWQTLSRLWGNSDFRESVSVFTDEFKAEVEETYKDKVAFRHVRDFEGNRNTEINRSLVGVTLLDFSNPELSVTEGISDFLARKLSYPEENVVGHTHLSWSKKDIKFITKYFKRVLVFSDNDTSGIKAASKFVSQLKYAGVQARLILPSSGYKDICEQFIKETTC